MARDICPCCDAAGGAEGSIYCDLCLAEKRAEWFRYSQQHYGVAADVPADCVITRATRMDTDCEVELMWLKGAN